MFGQQPAKPLFGTATQQPTTTNLFGNTSTAATTGFGAAGFGATNATSAGTSLFGPKPNAFGTPAVGTSLFGTPAATTSLFGQPTATTSLFGNTTTGVTAGGFGAPTATSSGLFGAAVPKPAGSMFGATTTASSGFGVAGFGTTGSNLFGQPTASSSGTSLFGGTTGAPTGTSLFGGATAATAGISGTPFKFSGPVSQDTMMKDGAQRSISCKHQCATAMKEYENKSLEELRVEDYLVNRKGPQPGATGGFGFGQPTAAPASTGGLFGAATSIATPGTSMFGSTGIAQSRPNLFGTSTASTGGLFGQQPTTTTSLFGNPQPQPLFGGVATTSAPAFAFGGATNTSAVSTFGTPSAGLFGSTAGQTGTGLFGATTTTAAPAFGSTGLFGAPRPAFGATASSAAPTFGAFGAAPVATTMPFGATTNMFGGGSAARPTFGAPTLQPGFGAFGATTTQPSMFGATATQPAGSLFGAQPRPGLFGQPAATTQTGGLFGAPASQPLFGGVAATQPATGGLFGSQARPLFGAPTIGTGSTTFGQPAAASSMFGAPQMNFGSAGFATQPPMQPTIGTDQVALAAQQAIVQHQLAALASLPYGDSALLRSSARRDGRFAPTDPIEQRRAIASVLSNQPGISYVPSIMTSSAMLPKPPPRVLLGIGRSAHRNSGLFDELKDESISDSLSKEGFVPRKNVKKLVLKPKLTQSQLSEDQRAATSPPNEPGSRLRLRNFGSGDALTTDGRFPHYSADNEVKKLDFDSTSANPSPLIYRAGGSYMVSPNENDPRGRAVDRGENGGYDSNNGIPELKLIDATPLPASRTSPPKTIDRLYPTLGELASTPLDSSGRAAVDRARLETVEPSETGTGSEVELPEPGLETRHPARITLNRSDYSTSPTLEELADMTDPNGDCVVENGFEIKRSGYGSILWPGRVEVHGLDLDEIVHFRHKEVTVYPDESLKPPVGMGLNRHAEISLERVWPNDKSTHTPIKDVARLETMKFRDRLETTCSKLGAEFKDYQPDTGVWSFVVNHFSKYGLSDDADDEAPSGAQMDELKKQEELRQKVQRTPLDFSRMKPVKQSTLLPLKGATMTTGHYQPTPDTSQTMHDLSQQELYEVASRSVLPLENTGMDDDLLAGFADDQMALDEFDSVLEFRHRDSGNAVKGLGGSIPATAEFEQSRVFSHDQQSLLSIRKSFFAPSRTESPSSNLSVKRQRTGFANLDNVLLRTESLKFGHGVDFMGAGDAGMVPAELETVTRMDQTEEAGVSEPYPQTQPMMTIQPRLILPKSYPMLVDYEDSFLKNRSHLYVDACLFNNRRFRVGWGQNRTITLLAKPSDIPRENRDFIVDCRMLEMVGSEQPEQVEAFLKCQLENSTFCPLTTSRKCPFVQPNGGVKLLHDSMLLVSERDMGEFSRTVWSLCFALWGQVSGYSEDPNEQTKLSYTYQDKRKELLSLWISEATIDAAEAEVQKCQTTIPMNSSQAILSLLSVNKTADAAKLALKTRQPHLAMLIGQSSRGQHVKCRELCIHQLQQWKQCKADKHIDTDILKIYCLISGCHRWTTSDDRLINPCEDLDWKRCFGEFLWYFNSPIDSIQSIVETYESSFCTTDNSTSAVAQPLPKYLESSEKYFSELSLRSKSNPDSLSVTHDVCFRLLKLSCGLLTNLADILDPLTYTAEHLNYHMSWHLFCLLRSVGYNVQFEREDYVHIRYAEQLCHIGLDQWAFFVLQHISDHLKREREVKKLLSRFVVNAESHEIGTIVDAFGIPQIWVFEAKALYAKYTGDKGEECWFSLKAEAFNFGHELFLEEVGPRLVIDDDISKLQEFIDVMKDPSDVIADWVTGGGIFMEYLQLREHMEYMRTKFASMDETDTDELLATLDDVEPLLLSLSAHIRGMSCKSPLQRFCQGEIASHLCRAMQMQLECAEKHNFAIETTKLPLLEDEILSVIQGLAEKIKLKY